MKEGIVFTFLWFTILTQENGGRREREGKGKKQERREGGERLLYSHFCGSPSS